MSRSSSAVVDSKVVELSFENSNFEKNATTSLSTIQKLKQALNFSTSNDGLERVGDSVKKINFNPISAGIDAAKERMSAFEAVSLGFFTKIGSRIEETAHKYTEMFSATKMAMDGFSEYETKMGSIQTILMGARDAEGLPVTLDMVNQKLDELNTYADKTIYSFSDMTSNIGKFTNAGVDLDSAVAAIQGISNEAALAGANTQQASHAMYNFAQALSSGSVKLTDWKSIEYANMATVDFKQTLIDTAVECKTLVKEGEKYISTTTDLNGDVSEAFDATSMFNESLKAQWMNTEVLTKALAKYADETTELGQKAFKAATEVKTFSQLIDTLQEAMGSGWAQTWEIVIGDFEQSKELFTTLSDTFGGIIDAQAKARNALLEGGLGKPAKQVTEDYINNLGMTNDQLDLVSAKLIEVGKENGVAFKTEDTKGFIESLKDGWLNTDMLKTALQAVNGEGLDTGPMVKSLDEFSDAALRVIKGDFTNDLEERFRMLNEEGFDAQKVQDYVNEIHRLTDGTWEVNDAIMAEAAANVGLSESMEGVSGDLDDIIKKVSSDTYKKSGRELLFDALKTSIFSLKTIFGEIKGAFREVFPPATAETVYKIAKGINDASKGLRRFALKNAENIHSTFLGIFKALDLVLHTGKTVISTVFKGISNFFKGGDGKNGILAFTANIGNLIGKFHDWVIENEIVEKAVGKVGDTITAVVDTIKGWIDAFMQLPAVQNIVEKFGNAFDFIKTNFPSIITKAGDSLKSFTGRIKDAFSNIKSPKDFFDNIKNAFSNLFSDISGSTVFQKISEAFGSIGTAVKTFFTDLGTNADGTRNTFGKLTDGFGKFFSNIKNLIKGVDENGEKIDVFAGIKSAFTNLGADISASGVVENIKSGLKTVWSVIDGFFTSLGSNADGTKNLFGQVWEGLTTGLGWVVDKAIAAKDAIHGFFTEHKLGKFFGDTFTDISAGVGGFFTKIPGFVVGAKDKFVEFIEKVKEFGGLKLDNLGNIWKSFKDTVGKYFAETDIFKPILDAFSNIGGRIAEKASEFGVDLIGIKDKIVEFFTSIKDAFANFSLPDIFQKLVDFFTGKGKEIADGAGEMKDGVGGFFENVVGWIKKINVGAIAAIVGAFLGFKALKFIGTLVKPVEQLISAMANEKNARAAVLNKAAWLEVAATVGIFALVIYGLSKIPVDLVWNGVGVIAALMALMALFSILTNKFSSPESMSAAGKAMLEVAVAVGIFTFVLKQMADFLSGDIASVAKGIGGVVVVVLALIGLSKLMNKMGGMNMALAGGGLLATVGAIMAFVFALLGLALIPMDLLLKGILHMIPVFVAFAGMLLIIKKIIGESLSVSIGIAGLAACIVAIAAALWIISKIDPDKLLPSVLSLGALLLALGVALRIAGKVEGNKGAFIGLAVTILALAAALAVLSLINPADLIAPTIALGALLVIIGFVLKAGEKGKVATGALVAITLMVAVLAAALYALASLPDWKALIAPTVAMGALLVLIAIVIRAAKDSQKALAPLAVMTIMVAAIGAVLYALATLPDPMGVVAAASGIGIVLLAVAAAVFIASKVGAAAFSALPALAVMGIFIAGFVALAWAIGALAGGQGDAIKQGIQIIIDVFAGLGTAIGKFIANLVTESFGALPAVAESIVEFMRKLSELNDIGMVDIGPLLEALGAIFGVSLVGFADSVLSIVSELEEGKSAAQMLADDMTAIADAFVHYQMAMSAVDGLDIDSTPLLEAVGTTFVASLAGFGDSLLSIVSELEAGKTSVQMLADDMSYLADGFTKYADTMARFQGITIDTTALENAVDQVLHASLVGFADGLTSIVTEIQEGKTSVQTVADDMSALADGFSKYAEAMNKYQGITIDTQAINDLTDAIGEVSFQGLLDSLMNLIPSGDAKTQVERFSEDMGALADALVEWQNQMAPLSSITVPTDSINQIKEAMDSIKEGGIIDDILNFFGMNTAPDYTSFTEGVKGLGKAINSFSNSLGENFDPGKLNTAVSAIKKLSEVGVALGDVDFGGWFHDGVLTTFANELVEMAPRLNDFVSGFANLEQFTQVASGVDKIASAASKISTIKFGSGDLTKGDVIKKLKANIDSLAKVMQRLSKIDTSAVDKVTSALTKLNSVSVGDAAKKVNELGSTNSSGKATGKQLSESVASGVTSEPIIRALKKAVSGSIAGIDTSKHKSIGTKLGKAVVTGIQSIEASLKSTTQRLVKTFGSTFTSSVWQLTGSIKASALKVGTAFGQSLAQGITNTASRVKSAAQNVAKGASDAANAARGGFQTAGRNFSQGLANGILAGRSAAISAAIRVAADALSAAKKKLDEHSPSKETEEVGMFFSLGLANGIRKWGDSVYDESAAVATLAMDGLQNAVKMASQMVLGDGMESPVITPIVDLSEIENGASMISGIFGSQRPDVTLGNLSAISFSSNMTRQNADNTDILAAIHALGANLGNSSGDTITINGITYDDGSNVSDAVRDLMRAIKIERRA